MRCLKKLRRLLVFALLLLFFSVSAQRQCMGQGEKTGAIRGKVRRMFIRDGRIFYSRIEGVKINLEFTDIETFTAKDGTFQVKDVPVGEYRVIASLKGQSPVSQTVKVYPGRSSEADSLVFYVPGDESLPKIIPGSMIASFNSEKDEKKENKDTPMSSLVFYRPQTTSVYLEINMEEKPSWIVADSSGRYLAVATRKSGLFLWDLKQLKVKRHYKLARSISDVRFSTGSSLFYVTYFGNKRSGVVAIDPQTSKIEYSFKQPARGVSTGVWPVEEKNFMFLVISRLKQGGLAKIDLQTGEFLSLAKLGALPMSLLYLENENRVMVTNFTGKTVMLFEGDQLKLKSIINLEGTPCRLAAGPDGKKAYVTVTDKNRVSVLDTENANVLGNIPVGKKPFWLKRWNNLLFVCNREDANISIIDLNNNRVIGKTPPEKYDTVQAVEILP